MIPQKRWFAIRAMQAMIQSGFAFTKESGMPFKSPHELVGQKSWLDLQPLRTFAFSPLLMMRIKGRKGGDLGAWPGGGLTHRLVPAVTMMQWFCASQLMSLSVSQREWREDILHQRWAVSACPLISLKQTHCPSLFLSSLIIFRLEVGQELVLSLHADRGFTRESMLESTMHKPLMLLLL